ncbi:hypothetical protein [Pseudomonas sp. Irchel 3E13]|uniref:hypothetical protein n=1 Tax=Pseudomonas sp. Irchel 3E13 TaxID=2008975 RepID=UPI000BA427B2|nr:hypothetical protein [Pseudomonas sp. Irchel 3E13]
MQVVGKFVGKVIASVVLTIAAAGAWASEFQDKAERIFSPSVIESLSESGANGKISFKIPERVPDYFESGDKTNKVFAIESARLFRDFPSLKRLTLKIPTAQGTQVLDISRADIEKYYGVDLAAMNGNPGAWRDDFIQQHDTKSSRADFVKRFVSTQ